MQDLARGRQNHVTDHKLAQAVGREILTVRQQLFSRGRFPLAGDRDRGVGALLTLLKQEI